MGIWPSWQGQRECPQPKSNFAWCCCYNISSVWCGCPFCPIYFLNFAHLMGVHVDWTDQAVKTELSPPHQDLTFGSRVARGSLLMLCWFQAILITVFFLLSFQVRISKHIAKVWQYHPLCCTLGKWYTDVWWGTISHCPNLWVEVKSLTPNDTCAIREHNFTTFIQVSTLQYHLNLPGRV